MGEGERSRRMTKKAAVMVVVIMAISCASVEELQARLGRLEARRLASRSVAAAAVLKRCRSRQQRRTGFGFLHSIQLSASDS